MTEQTDVKGTPFRLKAFAAKKSVPPTKQGGLSPNGRFAKNMLHDNHKKSQIVAIATGSDLNNLQSYSGRN